MYLLKETIRLTSKMTKYPLIKIQNLLLRWKRQRNLEITAQLELIFWSFSTELPRWWSACEAEKHQSVRSECSSAEDQSNNSGVKSRVRSCLVQGPKWQEGPEWTENLFGGHGTSGAPVFYHLWVAVTVSLRVGSWGRQEGGQRAGVGGDVVFVVVIWLGRPLRVTAGEEVGARPGHSSFLFRAGAAHLLPGNHRNIRSAAASCVRLCLNVGLRGWKYKRLTSDT